MKKVLAALSLGLLMVLLWGATPRIEQSLASQHRQGRRQAEITVPYTMYEWWLLRWADNELVCQLNVDHEGLPNNTDVFKNCERSIYDQWRLTGSCLAVDKEKGTSVCPGLYAHLISSEHKTKQITVDLPEPTVWVTLDGCPPKPIYNYCTSIPSLLFTAQEPLPNERPIAIHGVLGGYPFVCPGGACSLPLRLTSDKGAIVDFWMESSYGDSSEHYRAKIRILEKKNTQGNISGYYVDILSSQWRGSGPKTSCPQCWQSFPSPGGAITWLSNPDSTDQIASNEPFVFLAGRLISSGNVDASSCPDSGLLINGWASACGLEKARNMISNWQNRFNQQIIDSAQKTGLPSQLLKNVLAQESQFWPGSVFNAENSEYGLGRQTEMGSDTLLLWNSEFYSQFCPLVLEKSDCDMGYVYLSAHQQALLRGALVASVQSDCATCPMGIDLSHIDLNINVVAQMLQANCEQTGRIVSDITGKSPGDAASYDDLWRFTLVNYHAGPGCLSSALRAAWIEKAPLDWNNVSIRLDAGCDSALNFVSRIVNPGAFFTPIPVMTATALDTMTPSPEMPTATETQGPAPTLQPTETPTEIQIEILMPSPTLESFQPTDLPSPQPTVSATMEPTQKTSNLNSDIAQSVESMVISTETPLPQEVQPAYTPSQPTTLEEQSLR